MFPFTRTSILKSLKSATALLVATATLLMGGVSAEGVPTTSKVHASAITANRAPVEDLDYPNEIYGSVFDDFGDPAIDLQVDAVNSAGTVIDTVFTDADGWYNFFELPAATYKLHFVGDSSYEDEWYEDVYSRAAGTGLAVSNTRGWIVDAEVTWIDGGSGSGGGNGGDSSVEGVVTNSSGAAQEGVDVSAFDIDANEVSVTTTDADGYYIIDGLMAGEYTLCYDSVDYAYICLGGGADPANASFFYLGDFEASNQDFQLYNTGTVEGMVTDADGNLLEGIEIQFFNFTFWGSWDPAGSTATDADGNYSYELPEGYYRVVASPQDSSSTLEPQWYDGVSSSEFATSIQVEPDYPQQGIDFTLEEGSSIGVNTWCGSTGNECRNVPNVRIVSLDEMLVDSEKYASGSSVIINGLPAGSYKIQVDDYWWGGDGTEEEATVVYLDEGEDIRGITQVFPLNETGSRVSGFVTDVNGDPAIGYSVELMSESSNGGWTGTGAETDETGYYEFAGVNPGTYSLSFTAPSVCDDVSCTDPGTDYWGGVYNESAAEYFSTTDGIDLEEMDFTALPRTSRVTGTVRNAAGTPLSGVDVQIIGANGGGEATTAANGTYTVSGLAPGLYAAYGQKAGFLNAWWTTQVMSRPSANVALGATGTINLSLAPATGQISGRVTGSNNTSIGLSDIGVVVVRKSDGCMVGITNTDESGNYTISGLAAGTYTVLASPSVSGGCGQSGDGFRNPDSPYIGEYLTDKPNLATANPITLTAGQNLVNQNFVLQLGASISGFVGLADGSQGYSGLSAEAYGSNDELIGFTAVNANGSFTIQGLPAGVYYVKVSADNLSLSPSWYSDSSGSRRAVALTTAQNISNLYVELDSAATLTGAIRSLDGVPVAGRVDAVDAAGNIIASTQNQSVAGAQYSFKVPSGIPLRIRATVSGQEFWLGGASTMLASPWVTGNAGDYVFVRDIITPEPAQITGRVTIGGNATDSGWLQLLDATGQAVADAYVKKGAYSFVGVMPGTYTLLAHLGGTHTVFYGNKDSIATASYVTAAAGSLLEGIDIDAPVATAMFAPGTVALTGVPKVGTAMSLGIGTWTPAPASVLYRWYVTDNFYRGGSRKAVGTASSYTIVPNDLGKYLSVEIYVMKNGYVSDSASIPCGKVTGLALTASPVPTITGGATAKVGTVLTAVPGSWTPSPVTIGYQWMKAGQPIPGATAATYTPTAADAGARLSVRTIGTKAGYALVLKESAQTAAVALQTLTTMPVPTITGTARVGSVLTANPGTWAPAPVGLSYQWKRNGTNIQGATAPTYLLTAEDQGRTITVSVIGSKVGFTQSAAKVSAATATVAAPPAGTLTLTPTPVITGTAAIDETLTVTTGTWGPGTVNLSIQWTRNGVPIFGANATTYRLTSADVNATIRVSVKGTRIGYFAVTKVSAATAPVESSFIDADEIAYASIVGTGTIGSPLEVELFDVYPDDVYIKYQWMRDGIPIRGAKRSTYVPVARDEFTEISVVLTLAKPGYVGTEIWSDSVTASY